MNKSTDSSSDCLKPCNWFALCESSTWVSLCCELVKNHVNFLVFFVAKFQKVKDLLSSSPIHSKIHVALTFSSFWFKGPSKMSLQYFLKLLNSLGRSDPLQSIIGGLHGALYEELNFQSSFIGFISLFQISVSHSIFPLAATMLKYCRRINKNNT